MSNRSYDIEVNMEACKVCKLSEQEIAEIKDLIPADIVMENMSDFFKNFGDKTRVRILFVLQEKELCVNDIALLLDMSQSAISHQLRVLKQARLVKYRRNGKEVIYSLSDSHIQTIFDQALEHVEE